MHINTSVSNIIYAYVTLLVIYPIYGQSNEIKKILSQCHRNNTNFDSCVQRCMNEIRPFFKSGIPDVGIGSFDPHYAELIEQRLGDRGLNYNLKLRHVYEHGWTISKVTKFKSDWDNNRIIYSQYFPEKSLLGDYSIDANVFGIPIRRKGNWNLTLFDYAQTTTITRNPRIVNGEKLYDGQPLDVRVEIDKIGNMDIHVSNILNGANVLERMLDSIINASWRPGFAVVRPLINNLVSTAFTKIWSESFKSFPFNEYIQ